MNTSEKPERDYRVCLWGEAHPVSARSRSAARYASYRSFREAGFEADLMWFAKNARLALSQTRRA